jgi:hypothetical protein
MYGLPVLSRKGKRRSLRDVSAAVESGTKFWDIAVTGSDTKRVRIQIRVTP